MAGSTSEMAEIIISQLTKQTSNSILEMAFSEEEVGIANTPGILAQHPITQLGLNGYRNLLKIDVGINKKIIGLGASAATYYPAVGKKLNCDVILPEYAGVANAIGAVVGKITMREMGVVSSPSEGKYLVHFDGKPVNFNNEEDALKTLEKKLTQKSIVKAKEAGAELIIVINGSPYEKNGQEKREKVVKRLTEITELPFVYLNMIGGQDELIFDGSSFVMDKDGEIRYRAKSFEESLDLIEFEINDDGCSPIKSCVQKELPQVESIYKALVRGTRDYIKKHKFPGVVLGLSGGIDSALTLAIACDAIGPDKVRAVMMPYIFTSDMSKNDAKTQASLLNVQYDILPISPIYTSTIELLKPIFMDAASDSTEENIQSRSRGIILMAISNKTGLMLLTTGNKSEMAVGYATLYGDMAGGFAPIKDCTKTMVKKLASYRNTISEVIPKRVIEREPSAELSENQRDSDTLPPYEILDPILEAFIEEDLSVEEIVDLGFDRATVIRVLEMVKRNEYKRRQTPPGVRISNRAFGRDWRYPITSGYNFPK